MPEGHTVHRIARLFTELFEGYTVVAESPQGRFATGAKAVSGRELVSAIAIGKQLFLYFDNDLVIRVHLGIYGAWDVATRVVSEDNQESGSLESWGAPRVRRQRLGEKETAQSLEDVFPPPPIGQVRLRMHSDFAVADLRGPTACEVITPHEADQVRRRLGPDPLVDTGRHGEQRFVERVSQTRRPIGLVLMDQSVVSGIGNVYRAEILFRHQLDPYRPASSLETELATALWQDWRELLRDGVKTGVMITRADLDAAGRKKALRSSAHRYYVYKRQGQPCLVCGNSVAMDLMATRKLYFCPSCQT